MSKEKGKKCVRSMRGTIMRASGIRDFLTSRGRTNRSAVLHIQEDANDEASAQVAVKVSGELCNYVGCVGSQVAVDYVVRVFDFVKNGILMLGNDVYATSIRMI